jgi:hypothetical protein
MCPIPYGFQDKGISLYSTLYRRAHAMSSHELQSAIDVDGGIFENLLY